MIICFASGIVFVPENASMIARGATDPSHKCQAEIDIMGTQDKETALFAECKWTNEKIDLSVLETLVERSNLFSYKKKHFFLFSKAGFTKGCADKAKELGNVSLVTYKEIINSIN